jgi:hypothetical protein
MKNTTKIFTALLHFFYTHKARFYLNRNTILLILRQAALMAFSNF